MNYPLTRVFVAALFAVGGLVLSICAVAVSRSIWRPGDLVLPWGLLLGTAGSVAAVRLAKLMGGWQAVSAVAGWLLGMLLVLGGRPEGDFAIAGDGWGYAFLLGATVCVIAAGLWEKKTR